MALFTRGDSSLHSGSHLRTGGTEDRSASELRFPAGCTPRADALPLESPPPSDPPAAPRIAAWSSMGLPMPLSPLPPLRLPVSLGSEVGPAGCARGSAAHGESADWFGGPKGQGREEVTVLLPPALGPQAPSWCQRCPRPRLPLRMWRLRLGAVRAAEDSFDCSPALRWRGVAVPLGSWTLSMVLTAASVRGSGYTTCCGKRF